MNSINNAIDVNGKYNYAYVVMLIKKNIYATASIVLVESLRKVGCMGDLVLMIDKNIDIEILNMVKIFYNKIIEIEPIEITHDNQVQQIILSKIYSFRLIEYKKIFLIDVDTIFLTNIDNFFINCDCPCISHFENKPNYGFMLIEPSNNLYLKSIKIIKKFQPKLSKISKPFEFLMKKLYKKIKKLNINTSVGLNLEAINNLDVDLIQFVGDKPFLMSSSLTIEERMKLNHFKIWYSFFINILNKFPELKKIKTIQETIDVSKYFLSPLARFIVHFAKLTTSTSTTTTNGKKLNQITNIYGIQKYNNLNYYHIDISRDYSNEYINWISNINGIGVFLKYLTFQTKIDFIKFDKYVNLKEIINFFVISHNDKKHNDNKYFKLLNIFMNYYVKIFSNVFVIIKINNSKDIDLINVDDELDLKNNFVYTNRTTIDGKILLNIMFDIFQNYTYDQRIIFLKKNNYNEKYIIDYYIYETIGQINYFDLINNKSNLFVLFDKSSKIRFSSIFFNPNTLKMFNRSNLFCNYLSYDNGDILINKKSLIELIYFQTLKKWIYNTYSGNEIENIVIVIGKTSNFENFDYNSKFKLILIDNVTRNIEKMNKIVENKIFFVKIIFLKLSELKNIVKNKTQIINLITNPKYYWELDNIKFLNNDDINTNID